MAPHITLLSQKLRPIFRKKNYDPLPPLPRRQIKAAKGKLGIERSRSDSTAWTRVGRLARANVWAPIVSTV
jgi:hypothetical protein